MLKEDGNIWSYTGSGWDKIDEGTGTRQIAGDRTGAIYALKNNGNIWRYEEGWTRIDEGKGTKQIAAAAGVVYALKDNGNLWRWEGGWSKIDDGTGTKEVFATRKGAFIVKKDGTIWRWREGEEWQKISQERVHDMVVSRGVIYILRPDGDLVTVNGR